METIIVTPDNYLAALSIVSSPWGQRQGSQQRIADAVRLVAVLGRAHFIIRMGA